MSKWKKPSKRPTKPNKEKNPCISRTAWPQLHLGLNLLPAVAIECRRTNQQSTPSSSPQAPLTLLAPSSAPSSSPYPTTINELFREPVLRFGSPRPGQPTPYPSPSHPYPNLPCPKFCSSVHKLFFSTPSSFSSFEGIQLGNRFSFVFFLKARPNLHLG